MNVTLYSCSDDKRKINKTLTPLISLNVLSTDDISMLNPTFLVGKSNFNFHANYLYCDTFDRYYFIDNITTQTGGIIKIDCSIDVLYSHRTEILNINATAIRNEKIGINNIPDSKLPIISNIDNRVAVFKSPFSSENLSSATECFIVTTSGNGNILT